MDIREHLARRLSTLDSLTRPGALRRGMGGAGDLGNKMTEEWETERRLINRILGEPAAPADTLSMLRERTATFCEKYPDRDGWTDQQGQQWKAALVMKVIDNLMASIENWSQDVEMFDDEDDEDDEEAL